MGLVKGGSGGGSGLCSAIGSGRTVEESAVGIMGGSSTDGMSPTIGGPCDGSVSTATAEHLIVGFPVVPGGHSQNGRWLMV